MVKNTSFNLYAVTVSLPPQFGDDPTKYEEFHNRMRKNTKCSCYALERGKEGDHLHYHAFLHYHKNIRRDVLTKRAKTHLIKLFKVDYQKPMLKVSPAFNPIYWIENYLTKETVPVTFDMDLKPYLQRQEYYAVNKLGNNLIPLHQGNFELAIRTFKGVPLETRSFYHFVQELEEKLDKAGYQTKIFRSQTSFVHKTIMKIYQPDMYRQTIQKSIEKLISPV